MSIITIEDLEQIANAIETEVTAERNRLQRLIRAYARIIEGANRELFKNRPLEQSDEDGHYDNSYPPKIKYKDFSGPRLIKVIDDEQDQVATSEGFYYDWRSTTTDPGMFVGPDGALFGRWGEGTGQFGQFAAYPGDCSVMIEFSYDRLSDDWLSVDRLREAEEAMRQFAFPLVAARQKLHA